MELRVISINTVRHGRFSPSTNWCNHSGLLSSLGSQISFFKRHSKDYDQAGRSRKVLVTFADRKPQFGTYKVPSKSNPRHTYRSSSSTTCGFRCHLQQCRSPRFLLHPKNGTDKRVGSATGIIDDCTPFGSASTWDIFQQLRIGCTGNPRRSTWQTFNNRASSVDPNNHAGINFTLKVQRIILIENTHPQHPVLIIGLMLCVTSVAINSTV